jgi:hypothetical protein
MLDQPIDNSQTSYPAYLYGEVPFCKIIRHMIDGKAMGMSIVNDCSGFLLTGFDIHFLRI